MPVVDAVPLRDNPPAIVPARVTADSYRRGGAAIRRRSRWACLTIERSSSRVARSLDFVRAAFAVLSMRKRFTPATIDGCRGVAGRSTYPFTFVAPTSQKTPPRH